MINKILEPDCEFVSYTGTRDGIDISLIFERMKSETDEEWIYNDIIRATIFHSSMTETEYPIDEFARMNILDNVDDRKLFSYRMKGKAMVVINKQLCQYKTSSRISLHKPLSYNISDIEIDIDALMSDTRDIYYTYSK